MRHRCLRASQDILGFETFELMENILDLRQVAFIGDDELELEIGGFIDELLNDGDI